jgi:hypothetical protein
MTYNLLCRFSDLLCVALNIFQDQMELKDFEKMSTKYYDVCLYLVLVSRDEKRIFPEPHCTVMYGLFGCTIFPRFTS